MKRCPAGPFQPQIRPGHKARTQAEPVQEPGGLHCSPSLPPRSPSSSRFPQAALEQMERERDEGRRRLRQATAWRLRGAPSLLDHLPHSTPPARIGYGVGSLLCHRESPKSMTMKALTRVGLSHGRQRKRSRRPTQTSCISQEPRSAAFRTSYCSHLAPGMQALSSHRQARKVLPRAGLELGLGAGTS